MMKHDPDLDRLVSKILDDEPIDWGDANRYGTGIRELERLVQGFRHIRESSSRREVPDVLFHFGHLQVTKKIGAGALGDVYRAYDPVLDLDVALKLCKVQSKLSTAKALHEARCLARVRQANVLSVYGAAEIDGQVGIWSELVRGRTLEDLLIRDGLFEAEEVRSIGVDLCHALAAVHRQGLVHGDVKLENVMREDGGRIVLMDFGAAREFRDGNADAIVSGTLRYLAPEVLRGEPASQAADQYSLGVLLFRLLTGQYPYKARDYDLLCLEHKQGVATRLSDLVANLPVQFTDSVERSIQRDPRKRFGSVMAFALQLNPRLKNTSAQWTKVGAISTLICLGIALMIWEFVLAAPWQTQLQFYRITSKGRDPVIDGNQLTVGDRLALDFQSTKPVYLYVLDDNGKGSAEMLFPKQNMQPTNPLVANIDHLLPGNIEDRGYKWRIDAASADEEFIVIAATERQSDLEDIAHAEIDVDPSSRSTSLVPGEDVEIANSALQKVLKKEHLDAKAANTFSAKIRYWHYVFPHAIK